ncbi:Hsp20 family protein [Candidatus Poribacteria bacterium]|nr:Hsp20 family protein [Candidatus Poribacteria bacterium]
MSMRRRNIKGFGLPRPRDERNRMFDDFSRGYWPRPVKEIFGGDRVVEEDWFPSVDVSEKDEEVIVTAEIPGVDQEDLEITFTRDVLTIKGEKKEEEETREDEYHRAERCYGCFQRSISLPAGIEGEKAKAKYKDGVLRITLPKSEKTKQKKIKVNIE